ncbi:SDR family oxidoreductase [Corallococcus exiguus]|uniref:SDR family oxidoreductase n=1 Tax=Corallococcus exiguus TaxID=83462 RepID=UPI001A8E93D5|nr:SDR family oxidoreductase [Corallococcus exiguus]MBN8468005.1 SDR family oxidoreductase [Corallococcus exiguus]
MADTKRIALITGGSRGLGRNSALKLARAGVGVVLTFHSRQEEAEAVVAEIQRAGQKAVALQLDTSKPAGFEDFAAHLKEALRQEWDRTTFDFLVNNAGTEHWSPVGQTEEAAIDAMFGIHFKGVYLLTKQLLPLLENGGRVINFSTGLARFTFPGYAAYASMKAAVEAFTRYLAKELGPRRISCNTVAPGPVDTDFTKGAFEHNPGLRGMLSEQTALGRVGVPDDIGGVVAFLCSEDARWITGQRLEASGGLFL